MAYQGRGRNPSVDVVADQLAGYLAAHVGLEPAGAITAHEVAPAQQLRSLLGQLDVGLALLPAGAAIGQVANLDLATVLLDDGVHVETSVAEALEDGRLGKSAGHLRLEVAPSPADAISMAYQGEGVNPPLLTRRSPYRSSAQAGASASRRTGG